MGIRRCEGCGRRVHVAGGIGDIWNFGTRERDGAGGLVLEFEDGSEFFLCMECIDRLPDGPTARDVRTLGEAGDSR